LIANKLKKLGLEVQVKVAKTGVVGILRGNKKGETIAIRSDMDALPIQEQNKTKYASRIPGVMHACGHDGKIAICLGVAMLLSKFRHLLTGQVKFIFQPNEESSGGAQAMIAAGVLKKPKVDCIFGYDLSPNFACGRIGVRSGIVTANVDDFEISIIGQGGHAAQRWKTVDTVMAAAKIIEELQLVIPRQQQPGRPAVISIGQLHGGTAINVIPDCIELKGTVRTFYSSTRKKVLNMIEKQVTSICRSYKARHKLHFIPSYPCVENHHNLNKIVISAVKRLLGPEKLHYHKYPVFAGEDIGYFFQKVPGVIFSIGVRNKKRGIVHPRHSSFFNLDENALPVGVAVVTSCIAEYLKAGIEKRH